MGRLSLVVVALLLAPLAASQPPPPDPPPPPQEFPFVGDLVNPTWTGVAPVAENETAQDLRTEDISMSLRLTVRDAQLSTLAILFGGGRVAADARAHLALDFRAVSVARLDQALEQSTGDANMSLNGTFGIDGSRIAVTAEEIRLLGGGVVLAAFQTLQEDATRRLLESTLPGLAVLSAQFEWSNIAPGQRLRNGEYEVDLRDPPLKLDATVDMTFVTRYSLLELVEAARADPTAEEAARQELQERIEENQTLPAQERNAFMFLSYSQLFDLSLPPGWRLNLTMEVPKGFSIEGASQELVVGDGKRSASYFVDGSNGTSAFSRAGVVSMSNRYLVTSTVAAVVLVLGLVAAVIVETAALATHGILARRARRRARDGHEPS